MAASDGSFILPSKLDHITSTPVVGSRTKRKRMGSVECLKCDKTINLANDAYYTCSVCALDVCFPCTGISKSMHKSIQEEGYDCFMWTCRGCTQNFPSINKVNSSLATLDKKNDLRLLSLEEKIDNLDSTINNKIHEGISQMKSEVVDEISEKIQQKLKIEVRAEVREIDNQKSRAMNLIVFNLPESECDDSEDRIKEDKAMFEAICVSIGVPIVDVHSAFRLGNRQPTKIRPLKVIMMSKKQRKDVIDNAKFIGTKAPYPFRKVVIVKDLTPRQREENKQRRINKQHRNKQKSPAKINNEVQVHTNSSPMDQEGSSHRNAYSEETVLNTMVNNEETIIGGFSQDVDAAKLRALYPTEKGESPV